MSANFWLTLYAGATVGVFGAILFDRLRGLFATKGKRSRKPDIYQDVVDALVSMGYKKAQAERAVNTSMMKGPFADNQALLREALRQSMRLVKS